MVREAVDDAAIDDAAAAAAAPPRKRAAKKAAKKAPAKKAAKKQPAKKAAMVVAAPPEDPWERARKAHEAILAGGNWETVTTEHEYPSVEVATTDVRAYLAYVHVMTGDDERQVAKRIELDRLDAMWRQWWELGTSMKDEKAAAVLLKIGERRAKLLELEGMSQRQMGDQTIIITGGANMADELRAIALGGRQDDTPVALEPPQDVEDAVVVLD